MQTITLVLPVESSAKSLEVSLDDAYVVGTVRVSGDKLYIESGQIAGRWSANNAFGAVGALRVFDKPLCTYPEIFKTIQVPFCAARDLSAKPSNDLAEPCTAISIGIRFQSVPASLATFTGEPGRNPNLPQDSASCPPVACP